MKKVFLMMVCSILLAQMAFADQEIHTTDTLQLPVAARNFIRLHFPKAEVSHIKIEKELLEGNQYDVILTNGFDLDFDKNGEWKEIDGKRTALPASVIPVKIAAYLSRNFSAVPAVSIDRDKKGFDVKLSDGRELKFNRKQVFIGLDD